MIEKNECFIFWLQSQRIRYLDRYSISQLFERFLKFHDSLEFPLNQKYKNQKYNYHEFKFYVDQYIKIISANKKAGNIEIVGDNEPIVEEEPVELLSPPVIEQPEQEQVTVPEVKEESVVQVVEDHPSNRAFSEEEVFEQIENYVQSVCDINSNDYSLLISGDPGMGKSVCVEETLRKCLGEPVRDRVSGFGYDKKPSKLEYILGPTKIPPKELFCYLYKNNGRIIVLDDSDDAFQDPTSINILKKILDSKPVRNVGYGGKSIILKKADENGNDITVPNSFDFWGRVIVITNLYFRQINNAIKSRSLVVEVDLSPKECMKRVERLKLEIIKQVPNSNLRLIDEVIEHLKTLTFIEKIDLRTVRQSLEERLRNIHKWKRLVERSVFLKTKK